MNGPVFALIAQRRPQEAQPCAMTAEILEVGRGGRRVVWPGGYARVLPDELSPLLAEILERVRQFGIHR